jgi:fucose permease
VPVEDRQIRVLGYVSFALLGWTGLLVPTVIRSIEVDFGQTDAGIGLFYFVWALFYAIGGAGGGLLTERIGRRRTLPLAAGSLALGLATLALAPVWVIFLVGAIPGGLGGGAIDSTVNGLFLEVYPGRSAALNVLHLFFSIGASVGPLVVGLLIGAGAAWQLIMLGTSVATILMGGRLALARLPSGRHSKPPRTAGAPRIPSLVTLPLLLLALAIGCYVASEVGTANWLVRFLSSAPLVVATSSLSLFWGGLAVGRLIAAGTAERFAPIPYATACALLSGIAVIAAVLVPSVPVSIALFGLAGLAQGPIYPMIMTIGGLLQPGRSGAVSGLLTVGGVIGGLTYPPVIGFISLTAGIGTGLIGAGLLGIVSAGALVWAGIRSGHLDEVPAR